MARISQKGNPSNVIPFKKYKKSINWMPAAALIISILALIKAFNII
jgi:hypothetical protein